VQNRDNEYIVGPDNKEDPIREIAGHGTPDVPVDQGKRSGRLSDAMKGGAHSRQKLLAEPRAFAFVPVMGIAQVALGVRRDANSRHYR
jgi:hypothetical protein